MQKITIGNAAEKLGITKEAIYNRIRRGTLESITENGERFILLKETPTTNKQAQKITKVRKTVIPEERYVQLLISQIEELKATNSELNRDKDRLINEKEQILIEQKNVIERIYKERDEQLRLTLSLANRTLLATNTDEKRKSPAFEVNFQENDINSDSKKYLDENNSNWEDLKAFLWDKGFSKKKKKSYKPKKGC